LPRSAIDVHGGVYNVFKTYPPGIPHSPRVANGCPNCRWGQDKKQKMKRPNRLHDLLI